MLSQNKKVAIITSLTGGLGHYCAHLAAPLSKHHQLKFITYPQVDMSGATVKQITDSFVRKFIKWPRFDIEETNPLSIINICDYLNEKNIDIVNIHIGTTAKKKVSYFTTFILYAKQQFNKKFVFTLHDVLPFDEDKRFIKILNTFYSLADHFIVGNELEKTKLMKNFNIPEEKISIIYHGIYDLFNRRLFTKETARNYLAIPQDKKILLFFGFLREYKGFQYLVQAAGELAKKRQDFIVYVASGLKYASKDYLEKNLNLIQELGLEEYFTMNLNYLETLDIEAVMKASDVVVLPYIHASQSGVMMMAFGFQKPVIITESFYDKVWVKDKAGLVAKVSDVESLKEALNQMLDNPKQTKIMGDYGYDFSKQNRNWDTIATQYSEVFSQLESNT